MIHDHTATVLSLARVVLQGVDPRKEETSVRTASLVLLLQTLIDLGTPAHHDKTADAQARSVLGTLAAINGVDRGA
jgi:hypothetical protein